MDIGQNSKKRQEGPFPADPPIPTKKRKEKPRAAKKKQINYVVDSSDDEEEIPIFAKPLQSDDSSDETFVEGSDEHSLPVHSQLLSTKSLLKMRLNEILEMTGTATEREARAAVMGDVLMPDGFVLSLCLSIVQTRGYPMTVREIHNQILRHHTIPVLITSDYVRAALNPYIKKDLRTVPGFEDVFRVVQPPETLMVTEKAPKVGFIADVVKRYIPEWRIQERKKETKHVPWVRLVCWALKEAQGEHLSLDKIIQCVSGYEETRGYLDVRHRARQAVQQCLNEGRLVVCEDALYRLTTEEERAVFKEQKEREKLATTPAGCSEQSNLQQTTWDPAGWSGLSGSNTLDPQQLLAVQSQMLAAMTSGWNGFPFDFSSMMMGGGGASVATDLSSVPLLAPPPPQMSPPEEGDGSSGWAEDFFVQPPGGRPISKGEEGVQ